MKRFALWTLGGDVEHPVARRGEFPARDYSRFKHGDTFSTDYLASELRDYLDDHTDITTCSIGPVFPVAYHDVPPAYFFLVRTLVSLVNSIRQDRDLEPARLVRITKSGVTGNHYASSTIEQRREELSKLSFTLEEPVAPGAYVVAIDDIKITGLAEEFLLRCLHEAGVDDDHIIIGYLAQVDDDLAQTPQVESAINRRYVTSVMDMRDAINEGYWELNVRFLKDVLNSPDIEQFFESVPPDVAVMMDEAAQRCGPDFMAAHRHGIDVIRRRTKTV